MFYVIWGHHLDISITECKSREEAEEKCSEILREIKLHNDWGTFLKKVIEGKELGIDVLEKVTLSE